MRKKEGTGSQGRKIAKKWGSEGKGTNRFCVDKNKLKPATPV